MTWRLRALIVYSLLLGGIESLQAKAHADKVGRLTLGQTTVNYGSYSQDGLLKGDILYFHGFGDRFENHAPLFAAWNAAGFRVIGFNLPSHGDSVGTAIGGLDFHSFESLSELAGAVLQRVRQPSEKQPLLFAGWSLGGLLATRILQSSDLRALFPKVEGLILYTPAVAPQLCVGQGFCRITNETLTHDSSLFDRPIVPESPFKHPAFSTRLIVNSTASWGVPLPMDLQILILLAGDRDAYVHTPVVKKWVKSHKSNFVSRMSVYQCPNARHELDNEDVEFGRDFVWEISGAFASIVARGEIFSSEVGNYDLAVEGDCQSS